MGGNETITGNISNNQLSFESGLIADQITDAIKIPISSFEYFVIFTAL